MRSPLLKPLAFLPLLLLLARTPVEAAVIYSHTFDGSALSALNGTTVDGGSATWTAFSGITEDGTTSGQGSAWLPYTFGTGIYVLTANLNVSSATATSFATIAFTNSTNFAGSTGDLSSNTSAYGTFGQRGDGTWDFWSGGGSNGAIDGSGAGAFPKINTVKLVLDTTVANWTLTASLLNSSGVEIFADLNGASSGVAYTYATNPVSLKGVGFFLRAGTSIDSLTLSVIPEPATFGMMVLGLGGCVLLRRFRRVANR